MFPTPGVQGGVYNWARGKMAKTYILCGYQFTFTVTGGRNLDSQYMFIIYASSSDHVHVPYINSIIVCSLLRIHVTFPSHGSEQCEKRGILPSGTLGDL